VLSLFIRSTLILGLLIPFGMYAQTTEPADSTLESLTRISARWVAAERQVELFWIFGNTDLYYGFHVQRRSIVNPVWETIGYIETGQCQTCLLFYTFVDPLPTNDSYFYRLKILRINGNHEFSDDLQIDIGSPQQFILNQSYPNPFNNRTTIHYWLVKPADISFTIYNFRGQQIYTLVEASQQAGFQRIIWDGQDAQGSVVSSGTYFYRLQVDGAYIDTKRMLFIK